MKEGKIWYLKQIYLFQGISDEEIMGIANKVVERTCKAKELIYTPFDVSDTICVLKRGEVTLYNSHYGKKLIIDVLKPGSVFGNLSLKSEKNLHFAEATEDALFCCFTVEDFKKIIQAHPEITIRLLQEMSNRMEEYEKRLQGGLFDAKEKIIHHLKILESKNKVHPLRRMFSRKVSHVKLSQHTGLSRETVTRAINDLKKEGRIQISESGDFILKG